MILGLGIDLQDVRRVQQELSRGEWLIGDGIFTAQEILYCSRIPQPARRYAACFAAKEATLKALGVQVDDLAIFREVEVALGSERGCGIVLHDRMKAESERRGVRHIKLSVTHHAGQTGAIVVLEN